MLVLRIVFFFLSWTTLGYIPPGDWLIDQLAKKCPEIPAGGIILNSMVQNDSKQDSEVFFSQTNISPTKINIQNLTQLHKKQNQKILLPSLDFISDFFDCLASAESRKDKFLKFLQDKNININQVGLKLFMGKPVFVLGFNPENSRAPTLWLAHNNFWPIKLKYQDFEITYSHWTQIQDTKLFFPIIITQKTNQQISQISTAHGQNQSQESKDKEKTKSKISEY